VVKGRSFSRKSSRQHSRLLPANRRRSSYSHHLGPSARRGAPEDVAPGPGGTGGPLRGEMCPHGALTGALAPGPYRAEWERKCPAPPPHGPSGGQEAGVPADLCFVPRLISHLGPAQSPAPAFRGHKAQIWR